MPVEDPTISKSGIYQIRCLVNGKVYIGSAVNIQERWKNHRSVLKRRMHHSSYLQNSWNKYGADQFVFEVLQLVAEKTDLIHIEQEWLDRVRPFDQTVGFNVCCTAGSLLGTKRTPETRAKISRKSKGRTHSPETRALISAQNKGRIHGPETRAKVSLALKARIYTPEMRANISRSAKGRTPSEESRTKNREAHLGRKLAT